jgi:hypothetical protein
MLKKKTVTVEKSKSTKTLLHVQKAHMRQISQNLTRSTLQMLHQGKLCGNFTEY